MASAGLPARGEPCNVSVAPTCLVCKRLGHCQDAASQDVVCAEHPERDVLEPDWPDGRHDCGMVRHVLHRLRDCVVLLSEVVLRPKKLHTKTSILFALAPQCRRCTQFAQLLKSKAPAYMRCSAREELKQPLGAARMARLSQQVQREALYSAQRRLCIINIAEINDAAGI